ncbi:MAG TPA: hypothetical protein VFS51_06995, partial [Gemmatimonadales bacterium]|nr:hypothetical protein [Gemmatimonadales bacterium]
MTKNQLHLMVADPALPKGFKYQPDIISAGDEQALLGRVKALPFRDFEFHGFVAKRRVVSYGWQYDFSEQKLRPVDDIPSWLLPLREVAAGFAGIVPDQL